MTLFGEVQDLRTEVQRLKQITERNGSAVSRHEDQISGERGLFSVITGLSEEVRSLKRTIWQVGAGIVSASIIFSISVLTVFGH